MKLSGLRLTAVAFVLVLAQGCGGGAPPTGAYSPATGLSAGATTGGGGGGGGGGTGSIRLVGFDLGQMLPVGPGWVWLFAAQTSGGTFTNPQVKVNGTAVSVQIAQFQNGTLFIDLGALTPAPAQGAKFQVVDGTAASNTVTMTTTDYSQFASGNTPAGTFDLVAPTDMSVNPTPYPAATPFSANVATGAGVSTYGILVLTLDWSSGQTQLADIPLFVELNAPSGSTLSFTAGSTSGVATEFVNGTLPALAGGAGANPTEAYSWNGMVIDASGWGIGTTCDVAGFSASTPTNATIETWPWFETQ